MVRILDELNAWDTAEEITDNLDTLKVVGNNCYIFGGFGADVIKVEGNNNILDGWYGNRRWWL